MSESPPPIPKPGNGLATCSLVCGICGFFTGPLSGIPAVVTGHLAKGKIRKSGGVMEGGAAATTGIVLGWITSALWIIAVTMIALAVPQIQKALVRAALLENLNDAKSVKFELDGYAADYSGDFPPDLATLASSSGSSYGYSPRYRYTDPKTKVEKDWLYFPGQTQTSPLSHIILASPDPVDHRGGPGRIVVRIDSSTTVIPERDYQHQLRIQGASP